MPETQVDKGLQDHLTRNEQMWQLWTTMGVTEQTRLAVDFQFYATSQEEAQQMIQYLESKGLAVTSKSKRMLLFFKGWEIKGTETAEWSLSRLQDRTRELWEVAEKLDLIMEGIGAEMPATAKQTAQ